MADGYKQNKKDLHNKIHNLLFNLKCVFRGLKVYALVGKSGTGKSFRAKLVAQEYHIDAILDDGLLIKNDKILAGKTAKKEKYYLQAVKVALYDDPAHRQAIMNALEQYKLQRILILGTSEKMIKKIVYHLNLPNISKFIRIEDVSSAQEIEAALKSRQEGNHVIPVPAIELKRGLSHIILDSIKIFPKTKGFWWWLKNENVVEKTIVRPQFKDNIKGQLTISEKALSQMIMECAKEFDATIKPLTAKVNLDRMNVYVVKLSVAVPHKSALANRLHELRAYIISKIEASTGILISNVHIMISRLAEEKKTKK